MLSLRLKIGEEVGIGEPPDYLRVTGYEDHRVTFYWRGGTFFIDEDGFAVLEARSGTTRSYIKVLNPGARRGAMRLVFDAPKTIKIQRPIPIH